MVRKLTLLLVVTIQVCGRLRLLQEAQRQVQPHQVVHIQVALTPDQQIIPLALTQVAQLPIVLIQLVQVRQQQLALLIKLIKGRTFREFT